MRRILISLISDSARAFRPGSSSCARACISASSLAASSSVCVISETTALYSRNFSTIGSISDSAFACVRYCV